jgi:hypothetical protein
MLDTDLRLDHPWHPLKKTYVATPSSVGNLAAACGVPRSRRGRTPGHGQGDVIPPTLSFNTKLSVGYPANEPVIISNEPAPSVPFSWHHCPLSGDRSCQYQAASPAGGHCRRPPNTLPGLLSLSASYIYAHLDIIHIQ